MGYGIQVLYHAFQLNLIVIVEIRSANPGAHVTSPEAAIVQSPAAHPHPVTRWAGRQLLRGCATEDGFIGQANHLAQHFKLAGIGRGVPACRCQRATQGVVIGNVIGPAFTPAVPAALHFQDHALVQLVFPLEPVIAAYPAIGGKASAVHIHTAKAGNRTHTGALAAGAGVLAAGAGVSGTGRAGATTATGRQATHQSSGHRQLDRFRKSVTFHVLSPG